MDKDETIKVLNAGKTSFLNAYREQNPDWHPELSDSQIEVLSLAGTNLSSADLSNSVIRTEVMTRIDLSSADLSNSVIHAWDLRKVNLEEANLCGTKIIVYPEGTPLEDMDMDEPPNLPYQMLKELCSKAWSEANFKDAKFDADTEICFGHDFLAEQGAIPVSSVETQASDASRIKIFISYAWVNDDVVLAIDAWLRSKRLQTKLDKRDFFAGSRIRDEIIRVMSECQVILIFHSKDSADKPWPEFERELASDLEMEAKKKKREPPRIIYTVIDDTPLPSISEENKIAIVAKGKRFELVCEEIYHSILRLPRAVDEVDLSKWSDFVF